ncbi:flagellar biosynthetic protein FliO, partial [Methylopila sp. Yamaguchi]|uniref:flagellar biosynthetic protein FliO n=1 Tax=Methylopila sp. Yamaguchi TaxID=1437817 RepID=UPI001FCE531D
MFDQLFGFDVPTPIKFVLFFAGFILLLLIATWLIRRLGGKRLSGMSASGRSRQPRLGVLDVLAIDGRRRLVIVRRDNVEHLVLIGGPNDVVVESGILRSPGGQNVQREPSFDAPPTRTAPPQPTPAQGQPAPQRPAPVVAAERPQAQPVRAPEPARGRGPRVEAPAVQP